MTAQLLAPVPNPTLDADRARFLLEYLLPSLVSTRQLTRLIVARVPAELMEHRLVPDGEALADMLWYVTSAYHVFLTALCEAKFPVLPARPQGADVTAFLAWDEERFSADLQRVTQLSGQELLRPLSFAGETRPAADVIALFLTNIYNHVGQLLTWLQVCAPDLAHISPSQGQEGEISDAQLAGVAGGVEVTAVYSKNSAVELGWIAPPPTQAGLGSLFGPPNPLGLIGMLGIQAGLLAGPVPQLVMVALALIRFF